MGNIADALKAKQDLLEASERDRKAQDEFIKQQKVRMFLPIKEALIELRDVGVKFKTYRTKNGKDHVTGQDPYTTIDHSTNLNEELFRVDIPIGSSASLEIKVKNDLSGFIVGSDDKYTDVRDVIDKLLEVVASFAAKEETGE